MADSKTGGEFDVKSWKRVIIFRSSRMSDIARKLGKSALQYLTADKIVVVAQQGVSKSDCKSVFGECDLVYLPSGKFSLTRVSYGLLKKLRSYKADAIIIPYNNPSAQGYRQMELLALMSRAGQVIGVDSDNRLIRVSLKRFGALAKGAAIDWALPYMHLYPSLFRNFFPAHLYPHILAIDPTLTCNLRCVFCLKEDFNGEHLNVENLRKLKNAIKYAHVISFGGWGEPMLYPKLAEALEYIYTLNPKDDLIQIITNGTALTRKKAALLKGHLGRLIISLNASSPESYKQYMEYDFEKTLSRIREFMAELDEGDRRKIRLHFVAHSKNYTEIPDFVRLAKNLGVSTVEFNQFQMSSKDHLHFSLVNVREQYNEVIDEAQKLGIELDVDVSGRKFFEENPPGVKNCQTPIYEAFVSINGDLLPCCYAGSETMGNAYKSGFEAVWFGKKYRRLRRERYFDACKKGCVPFLAFDDFRSHFVGVFKETEEYTEISQKMEKVGTVSEE